MAESRIEELRRRVRREPGSRLFAQLAEEERKAGDLGEAIRLARAGLAEHPVYPAALLTLGRALMESGDAEGARMALQEAVKQAPDNILASRLLAQALEAVGDLEAAAAQYRSAQAMVPGDGQLEAQLQSLQAKLAQVRKAREVTAAARAQAAEAATEQEAAARTPASAGGAAAEAPQADGPSGSGTGGDSPPFSSSTLAELYLRQGFTERAVEVYRQVIAERPGEEKARARLAELVSLLAVQRAGAADDDQERRRRALERTIAGLEVLLGIARRR